MTGQIKLENQSTPTSGCQTLIPLTLRLLLWWHIHSIALERRHNALAQMCRQPISGEHRGVAQSNRAQLKDTSTWWNRATNLCCFLINLIADTHSGRHDTCWWRPHLQQIVEFLVLTRLEIVCVDHTIRDFTYMCGIVDGTGNEWNNLWIELVW